MLDNLGPVVSDNTLLRSILPSNSLNVAHINAQSLSPRWNTTKLDELRHIIQGSGIDVLGVSETWFHNYILNSAVSFDGFNVYRNDRVARRGGGVAIYISENLKSKLIYEHRDECNCEAIFVEVELSASLRILVGVVYLPKGNFSSYEHIVADVAVRYEHAIFMGDFNTNLFRDASTVRHFCNTNNLEMIHNSCPTHFSNNNNVGTLIDFFMVSNSNLVNSKGQVQVPALNSAHALIYLSYSISVSKCLNQFLYRDYSRLDLERCLSHLQSTDYSSLYETSNSDSLAEILNSIIYNAYDAFVPMREFRQKTDNWFKNYEITIARQRRDFAYRAFRENRCDSNWTVYCHYRNKLKSVIRKHRYRNSVRMFENCSQSQMWTKLRSHGVTIDSNGPLHDIDFHNFNASSILPPIQNEPQFSFDSTFEEQFSFHCIDEIQLFRAINCIKSNSIGSDGVPLRFLKLVYSAISRHLLHVINIILMTSSFPKIWKTARVVPIPKIRNASSIADFRPISVLAVFSKILEVLMRDQISYYLESNRMISDYQSGYRAKYNTTTLIMDMTETIRGSMDKGGFASVVFLDYSKAFDAISHKVLVNKLYNFFGFSLSACKLAYSFLYERSQFVQCGEIRTAQLVRHRGIPQGSILGPLFFTAYMNDIFKCCRFSTVHVFADDVQLIGVSHLNDILYFVNKMNDDLIRISKWSVENFLNLNPSKTRVMFFSQSPLGITLRIDGEPIVDVDHYKTLGFQIDRGMTFNYHTNFIISRISATLKRLYSINIKLPLCIRYKLGHALIMPLVLYGIEVYSGTSRENLYKIKLCLHRMVRYIYGLGHRAHVTPYLIRFLGTNFEDFINIRILLLFYKTFKYGLPKYILERFSFMNSSRVRGLTCPHFSTLYMQRSFTVRVGRLWNTVLPYSDRHFCHSLQKFKDIVKNHL